MSGSSLDGLDIVFAEFNVTGSAWQYEILAAACHPYPPSWLQQLKDATALPAKEYLLLHTAYGRYIGEEVNAFISANGLDFRVGLIASHGHTTFHLPAAGMTAQLGDGAAIAAVTGLPVVTDLRALDVAFGGQGAPIVPMGEKLLWSGYDMFLNIGGIANISFNADRYIAYDVCPANRVLNHFAEKEGKPYDDEGAMAAGGRIDEELLRALQALPYYGEAYPKSLPNSFGLETVIPLVEAQGLPVADALRTYCEHIALQVHGAIAAQGEGGGKKLLVTGGGAFNRFLVERIQALLQPLDITIEVPEPGLVAYKEALVMALIGVLRWRQEDTVMASVTGASRPSIGGALWTGQEA